MSKDERLSYLVDRLSDDVEGFYVSGSGRVLKLLNVEAFRERSDAAGFCRPAYQAIL